MPWVRIDDHFDEHPKFAKSGPLGLALWVTGLAYCNRNLTDGFIPWAVAQRLMTWQYLGPETDDPRGRVVNKVAVTSGMRGDDVTTDLVILLLLEAGLWEEVDGGYQVHDYGDFQPSKEDVLTERAKNAERQARFRSNAIIKDVSHVASNGVTNTVSNRPPVPGPVPGPESDQTLLTNVNNGADAPQPLRSYQSCLDALKASKNKPGELRDLIQEMYAVPIPDGAISRIAKMAGHAGGAGAFFDLAWSAVKSWPGVDDPLDWIAGAMRQKKERGGPPGRIVDTSEMANGTDYSALVTANQERLREAHRLQAETRPRDNVRVVDGPRGPIA